MDLSKKINGMYDDLIIDDDAIYQYASSLSEQYNKLYDYCMKYATLLETLTSVGFIEGETSAAISLFAGKVNDFIEKMGDLEFETTLSETCNFFIESVDTADKYLY